MNANHQTQRLSIELAQGGAPPSEFRIFASGEIDTTKGVFVFDDAAAKSVLEAAREWGNKFSLDYEHDSVNPFSSGPKPAAGWYDLELRAGELWAVAVEWTRRAAELLSNREYRFVSPTFAADEANRVTELLNVALTNLPATKSMTPLVANRTSSAKPGGKDPRHMNKLRTALAKILSTTITVDAAADPAAADDAADQAITDAVSQIKAALDAIMSAMGADAAAEGEQPLAEAPVEKQAAVAAGRIKAGQAALAEVSKLTAKVGEYEKASSDRERADIVAKLKADKKITPALETWALTADVAALKGFAAAAPVITQLSSTKTVAPADGSGLGRTWSSMTPMQKHELHNTDPDLYAALKADHERSKSNAG